MNLSQRVWNLSKQYKQELEMGLSVGIQKGTSAAELARQLKQYLNEPDKLFRRVRDEFGELQLSKNARAYHPGQGVYRSSYKNALRLTRSEINMSYRTAEQTRWRQFDFVVGYEIKLSKTHEERMPDGDICDDLAGRYPKDFVWTGWHPNDLCYCVSILKTDDEFWDDDPDAPSENEVTDVPEAFKEWVQDNADSIQAAEERGTTPYFVRDNKEYIDGILNPTERSYKANNNNASIPTGINAKDTYRGNPISRIIDNIDTKLILRELRDIQDTESLAVKAGALISKATGNQVSVSINKEIMPLDIAKAHLTELIAVTRSYNITQGYLTKIQLGYSPKSPIEHGETIYDYLTGSKVVRLTQVIDERSVLNAIKNSRCDTKRLPFSLASHEAGHLLYNFNAPASGNMKFFNATMDNMYTRYLNEVKTLSTKGDIDSLSSIFIGHRGSFNKINEFVAECFQEYRNSSHPSKYAKLVGRLIDKNFKK